MLILWDSLGKVVYMQVLNGKVVAESLKSQLLLRSRQFYSKWSRKPRLVVLIVGADPASQVYVRNKEKSALALEFESEIQNVSADITKGELLKKIEILNKDLPETITVSPWELFSISLAENPAKAVRPSSTPTSNL